MMISGDIGALRVAPLGLSFPDSLILRGETSLALSCAPAAYPPTCYWVKACDAINRLSYQFSWTPPALDEDSAVHSAGAVRNCD